MAAQRFDLVVVGSGTGLDVANWAAEAGWKVAIVERDALGGTCLNRGCIPSKLLIHSADVMQTIQRAHLFGLQVGDVKVDWPAIVRRVTASVDADSRGIEQGLKGLDNPKLFQGAATFVGPKRLRVNGHEIEGERFLLASGARPKIPAIPGLRDVPFMTSTEALRREEQPRSMVVLGGGYIAAELAHFYGALGTEVTIVHRRKLLLPREDEEIAAAFTAIYEQRFRVLLEAQAKRVRRDGGDIVLEAEQQGKRVEARGEALLVAIGVEPNSDTLDVAKTGVELDKEGFIATDAYLETNVKGIFALGDALGRYMYKHAANHEAPYAFQNMQEGEERVPVNYDAMPHAIFAGPQVAGVGVTEQELRSTGQAYLVGRWRYRDTAMGHALEEDDGFVKFLVAPETGKILGCHILGPEASTLIHEVIVAMKAGDGTLDNVTRAVHIHPALSEVIDRAATNLAHPGHADHAEG
ncbi:MAG TPA: dihydrolipoyl dehydrogenase [Candidatus Thermoplasmatota archaeon]|jgi:dihydrolipoamide dehydrogenase|nr:dihydrolipoyl dehydrogenase [Candidatus Thermoplasmatota archaeon]